MAECKNCKRNFKRLTKEDLCAFCYKDKTGEWAKEFTGPKKIK